MTNGVISRVGNKTYYQRWGKTIARTITTPKNPKTEDQSLQRVLLKAVIKSYSNLPAVTVGIDVAGGHKAYVSTPSPTYVDFVTAWNLQRGDMVTFVTVQKSEGKYEVEVARLVLDPRHADSSSAPVTPEINVESGLYLNNAD